MRPLNPVPNQKNLVGPVTDLRWGSMDIWSIYEHVDTVYQRKISLKHVMKQKGHYGCAQFNKTRKIRTLYTCVDWRVPNTIVWLFLTDPKRIATEFRMNDSDILP